VAVCLAPVGDRGVRFNSRDALEVLGVPVLGRLALRCRVDAHLDIGDVVVDLGRAGGVSVQAGAVATAAAAGSAGGSRIENRVFRRLNATLGAGGAEGAAVRGLGVVTDVDAEGLVLAGLSDIAEALVDVGFEDDGLDKSLVLDVMSVNLHGGACAILENKLRLHAKSFAGDTSRRLLEESERVRLARAVELGASVVFGLAIFGTKDGVGSTGAVGAVGVSADGAR